MAPSTEVTERVPSESVSWTGATANFTPLAQLLDRAAAADHEHGQAQAHQDDEGDEAAAGVAVVAAWPA